MKALNGIVKGEKSDKGIQKVHLEAIIWFLLRLLNWREGLEDDDSLMNSLIWDAHFASQNKPNDPSAAPIATIDSNEEQNNDKDHITPSQLDALFSSQKNPDDHSSVTNVTKDLDENETEIEDTNKTQGVLREMEEILTESEHNDKLFSCSNCGVRFANSDGLKMHDQGQCPKGDST